MNSNPPFNSFFNWENKDFPQYDGPPTVFVKNSADDINKYFYDLMRNTKKGTSPGTHQTVVKTNDSLTEILGYNDRIQSRKLGERSKA